MADPEDRRTDGAPPTHVHVGPEHGGKGVNWLPWLLLLAGLLALLFALSRCNRDEEAVPALAPSPSADAAAGAVVGSTPNAGQADALAGTSEVGGLLAGTEPTPRRFQFEKLNFDTASSTVRPADGAELDEVAAVLKQYGNARIRIAGYADARGPDPANLRLGKARAEAIKVALVGKGIDTGRIETASGGEADPVAPNSTDAGRAENRRTELAVLSR
jgi:outer membrane protein OmpA-like peptidoglycan-associated protein